MAISCFSVVLGDEREPRKIDGELKTVTPAPQSGGFFTDGVRSQL